MSWVSGLAQQLRRLTSSALPRQRVEAAVPVQHRAACLSWPARRLEYPTLVLSYGAWTWDASTPARGAFAA